MQFNHDTFVCRTCRKRISTLARVCPNCGGPGFRLQRTMDTLSQRKWAGTFWFYLLLALMGLMIVGCAGMLMS